MGKALDSMLILGLDQSITRTGWALYDAPGDERRIRCGSFSAKIDDSDAETQCDLFGREIKSLIGRHRPQFICWERARRKISAYPKKPKVDLLGKATASAGGLWTVNADQLLLPEIQGMIRAAAILYRIPFESVPPATWRAALYGPGGGKLGTAEAKATARQYCHRLGIAHDNADEAEAACIARWAATCSQRFRRMRFDMEAAA